MTIATFLSLATAVCAVVGSAFRIHRRYLRQEEQWTRDAADIRHLKEENELICCALSACLDGLQQLGANHTVPIAKERLDEHLNRQAHQ